MTSLKSFCNYLFNKWAVFIVLFSSHNAFFKPVNTVYKSNFKICKFFILILFSYFFEKIGGKPQPMSMSSIKKKLIQYEFLSFVFSSWNIDELFLLFIYLERNRTFWSIVAEPRVRRSPIATKIWQLIDARKFGYDVTVRT